MKVKDDRSRATYRKFEFRERSYELFLVTSPDGDTFFALAENEERQGPESQLFFEGAQIGDALDALAAELGKVLDEQIKIRGILADKSPDEACRELRTLLGVPEPV
ncbi:MAG TPA: hypothetical protein VFR03_04985 [Thermoanaerobaculia bacterium]|nr:hypothetical protein [Thermoanaerobaculia bacterium]